MSTPPSRAKPMLGNVTRKKRETGPTLRVRATSSLAGSALRRLAATGR